MTVFFLPFEIQIKTSHLIVPGTTPDPNIRLQGPANIPGVGVVQLLNNGDWGGVCDDNWDINDARVVCRTLCFE